MLLFNIKNEIITKSKEIKAHEGPVLALDWSHPRFGSLLATCGFDKSIIIWCENNSLYERVYEYTEHSNLITSLFFTVSKENDLLLICSSLDETISIHHYMTNIKAFITQRFKAHDFGVNSVSYSMIEDSSLSFQSKIVSCGNDGLIILWSINENDEWNESLILNDNKEENDYLSSITIQVAFKPMDPLFSFSSIDKKGMVSYWKFKEDKYKRQTINEMTSDKNRIEWNENGTELVIISSDGTKYLKSEDELNQQYQ